MPTQAIKQAMDQMLEKVQDFARVEIDDICKKLAGKVIIKLSANTFRIGRYILAYGDSFWTVTNALGDLKGQFRTKASAFHYALSMMQEKIKLADQIQHADEEVEKYSRLHEILTERIRKYKSTEQFALALFVSKLSECSHQLECAQRKLECIISQAKYSNLIGKI